MMAVHYSFLITEIKCGFISTFIRASTVYSVNYIPPHWCF